MHTKKADTEDSQLVPTLMDTLMSGTRDHESQRLPINSLTEKYEKNTG